MITCHVSCHHVISSTLVERISAARVLMTSSNKKNAISVQLSAMTMELEPKQRALQNMIDDEEEKMKLEEDEKEGGIREKKQEKEEEASRSSRIKQAVRVEVTSTTPIQDIIDEMETSTTNEEETSHQLAAILPEGATLVASGGKKHTPFGKRDMILMVVVFDDVMIYV